MQHRKIPVAAVQCSAHDRRDFDRAWPRILSSIERAAENGARLIVLPEATVPGYVLGREAVAGDQLARAAFDISHLAQRYDATIVYGSAKVEGNVTFNAAIAVGPNGDELGFAAKQFLWHFDRLWFAPGATLAPVDTPVGRLGLLVCADGRIPSIAATLVDRGAEVLVMPTAWVTSGRDPAALENVQADLMVNVRARENGVAFVAANKIGTELESVAYCGKSTLVDARGNTIARGGECSEEIVLGEVDIGPRLERTGSPHAPFEPAAATQSAVRGAMRFGFSPVTDASEYEVLEQLALQADALAVITPNDAACASGGRVVRLAGVTMAAVASSTLLAPRGLVNARLGGIDVFLCTLADDVDWHVRFARTRAAELRAYVVIFGTEGRSFAVDPDGTVIAGTFGDYRLASFVYDPARTAATEVAPSTDVLRGARIAEDIARA